LEQTDLETLITALSRNLQRMAWPSAISHYTDTVPIPAAVALVNQMSSRSMGGRVLLGLGERRSALVVDDGLGTGAVTLAREYHQVHALYTSPPALEIARARAEYLQVSNIQFVLSTGLDDLSAVPFDLDCAVVNCLDSKSITGAFCRQIFEHLKSGGSLLLTVEERSVFAARSMFVLYQRLRSHFRYLDVFTYDRGLTNSFELRPVLQSAFRKHSMVKQLALAFASNAFACVARKQVDQKSLLEEIRSVLGGSHRLALRWERLFFANPAGMTAIGRAIGTGRLSIIRVPLSDQAKAQHRRNSDNLQALARRGCETFEVPKLLACEAIHGYTFSAESAVTGKTIDTFNVDDEQTFRRLWAAAVDALESFHVRTAARRVLSGDAFDELVDGPLNAACKALSHQNGAENLGDISRSIRSELKGALLPSVFMHGDYTFDNMRFERGGEKVSGVFDWDLAAPAGLPLLDLLYFFVSNAMKRTGLGPNRVFRDKCVLLNFDAAEQAALLRYCRSLDLNPNLIRPLALLTWMYHIGVRTISPEPYEYCRGYWAETLCAIQGTATAVDPVVRVSGGASA
jgi:SAM-dependent methyltransferase